MHQEQFQTVVQEHVNWEFKNEGSEKKAKWGYVSTTPGGGAQAIRNESSSFFLAKDGNIDNSQRAET